MKKLSQWLTTAGVAAAFLVSAGNLVAQDSKAAPPAEGDRGGRGGRGGPGGDPAQFQQRMMENLREQMKVKDDAEWKVLEERITKVSEARREVGFGGGGRLFRRPGGDTNNNGGQGGGRGGFGGQANPEQEALDKAIDSNASKEEIKAAMSKLRAAKKEKEAKLATAQEELKKVLNTQQEAVALSAGLVK
ncbi:MAG: hypothetical protein EXS35_03380 [Pedosphaera sp.]|nr:hypothetical protein [Pedosphaera sp.]